MTQVYRVKHMKRIDKFLRRPHDPNAVHKLLDAGDIYGYNTQDVAPGNTITVIPDADAADGAVSTINGLPLKGNLKKGRYYSLYRHPYSWEAIDGINHRPELIRYYIDTILASFYSGISMGDGRAILLGHINDQLCIFDSVNHAINFISTKDIPNIGEEKECKFRSGCLLKDGRVLLAPYTANGWYIFNPKNKKLILDKSVIDVRGELPKNRYIAATCSNEEGYAIFAGYGLSENVVIREPNGTYRKLDLAVNCNQIVALPDGRFVVSDISKNNCLYLVNPKTNKSQKVSLTLTADKKIFRLYSLTLLSDNKTIAAFENRNSSVAILFNTETGKVKKGATALRNGARHSILLPDGNIGFISRGSSIFTIYNPYLDLIIKEYRYAPDLEMTYWDEYQRIVLLPSGKIIICGRRTIPIAYSLILTIPEISPTAAEILAHNSRG